MNLQPEENLLKWYLLGATSPEEDEYIEQNLRDIEEWRTELLLLEEELIDDYARGALSINECQLFEKNFLDVPERRRKLLIAQATIKYASEHGPIEDHTRINPIKEGEEHQIDGNLPAVIVSGRHNRWERLVTPAWKPALAAVLLLTIGIV